MTGGQAAVTDASGSGYGRNAVIPSEDVALTHVGFGTPMGELLRRYWQPVCLSSELTDLPKFLKILDEELVAYRDKSGRVGVLGAHCCHRGASGRLHLPREFCLVVILYGGSVRGGIDEAGWSVRLTGSSSEAIGDG